MTALLASLYFLKSWLINPSPPPFPKGGELFKMLKGYLIEAVPYLRKDLIGPRLRVKDW
jgi:hypothetical protein